MSYYVIRFGLLLITTIVVTIGWGGLDRRIPSPWVSRKHAVFAQSLGAPRGAMGGSVGLGGKGRACRWHLVSALTARRLGSAPNRGVQVRSTGTAHCSCVTRVFQIKRCSCHDGWHLHVCKISYQSIFKSPTKLLFHTCTAQCRLAASTFGIRLPHK